MSYSGAESSMDNGDHRQNMVVSGGGTGNRRRRTNGFHHHHHNGDEFSSDGCNDPEVWTAFADSFSQVQTVLDRNRQLIQLANENHQSRIPDNMVKNVAIIQELNGNISKVASIYSDMSTSFTARAGKQQRQGKGKGGACSNNGE